jgi:recombination protein RecA
MMGVRTEDYDEIVAKINKKYGDSIRRGNDYEIVPRISTGSLELDVAMGGGVPIGRWTRFYGGYHSTKTLTALRVAAESQAMGLTVAYYNVEKQYDAPFAASKMGVETDELTIVEGATIEEIGEKMEALMTVCHVHIIDSCSIAVSEDELNADIRDWRPGLTARAWGKVFRRLNERFDHLANTVVMIDQMRVNFRTNGEQPAGGRVFDHQSSMSVLFRKGNWIYRTKDGILDDKAAIEKGIDGQAQPSGYDVKCRVEKSRVSRPFRTATMRLDLDKLAPRSEGDPFDRTWEMVKAATHYGTIKTKGSYYYYTPPGSDEEQAIGQGGKKLRAFIEDNPDIHEEIRERAMQLVDH